MQLLDKKLKYSFDLILLFVGRLGRINAQDIRHAAGDKELDIAGRMLHEEVVQKMEGQGDVLLVEIVVLVHRLQDIGEGLMGEKYP